MNKEYLILRHVTGGRPSVKFIGPEVDAKSMMFHIIMNSENGFKKIDNDEGYEIVVKETSVEPISCKNSVSIVKEVTYYLYPLKEKYE
jgi:hypothetical protein